MVLLNLRNWQKSVLAGALGLFGQSRLKQMVNLTKQLNLEEIHVFNARVLKVRNRFHSEKMKGIDCLLTPGFVHCAFKAENRDELSALVFYMMMFNLLHMPAGMVPITEV